MKRLQMWQWLVIFVPMGGMLCFILVAAGMQIHHWHLSWIWAIFVFIVLGWRWAVVHWLQSPLLDAEVLEPLAAQTLEADALPAEHQKAQAEIQSQLRLAREDPLPWDDWAQFFRRCQDLIVAIAHLYHPEVQRPLLNIYIPQAYGLMRDTVDDLDRWMQTLAPALGQITVGQAYQAYETYQKLEPAARTALKLYNWARWIFNPMAAIALTATQPARTQANQKLLSNLGQLIREKTLIALGERAIALYSGQTIPIATPTSEPSPSATQSLQTLFEQAEPLEELERQPLQILIIGRTGAGKSSLINTLFLQDLAAVDILPSTESLHPYTFTTATGDQLLLWDTPGYEQTNRSDLRDQVLHHVQTADLLLLVTPALDPALQMDRDFLETIQTENDPRPIITVVSQVDRLRPFKEWHPPYDWIAGNRPKEQAIRAALTYRQEQLGDLCSGIVPLVTADQQQSRAAWGATELSQKLLTALAPAQQARLARFLTDQTTRIQASAQIIDQYALQMSTAQGLTQLLKSPVLSVLSAMMTGNTALATTLATGLPLEQAPIVMGKLQMAWELFTLLNPKASTQTFDLLMLWPLLLEQHDPVTQDAWALGQTLIEHWLSQAHQPTQSPTLATLKSSYRKFLTQAAT